MFQWLDRFDFKELVSMKTYDCSKVRVELIFTGQSLRLISSNHFLHGFSPSPRHRIPGSNRCPVRAALSVGAARRSKGRCCGGWKRQRVKPQKNAADVWGFDCKLIDWKKWKIDEISDFGIECWQWFRATKRFSKHWRCQSDIQDRDLSPWR